MSSPFAALLGTNYCPREDELAQITGLLEEPCLKLKRLDDEIDAMRKALDKLSEERDALNAYLQAHRALMSPIRRLPLDIIQEIFMACLPTHRNCVMSAQEAPVILGRICSSWRAISLATPRLWSRLHIVEPASPERAHWLNMSRDHGWEARVRRLEVANAWLRRSGQCPLSLSLESNPDPAMPMPAGPPINASASHTEPDPFLTALIQFASRWQTIRLVARPSALETLSSLTEDDVPLLKQLDIFHCAEDLQNTSDARWSVSQSGVLHAPQSFDSFYLWRKHERFGPSVSLESVDVSHPLPVMGRRAAVFCRFDHSFKMSQTPELQNAYS
ncbi:hypothetical protein MVEN_02110900 [Mycena venus]|uniref:F-box domain-containing protein n=1 Tax=Mycena venus TaxID=2733690 RepID=A0A8H6X9X3_9AGAR|nr:hypothetical protein MVEN_02110900 [Mycena venus]